MRDRKNIFHVGLEDWHRPLLDELPGAEHLAHHDLLECREVQGTSRIDVPSFLQQARERLERFDGSVDGITTYWDFPASCMLPLLCEERGLPHAPLDRLVACHHKYWSRLLQSDVCPEAVPAFCAVDPFQVRSLDDIPLDPPFWLKPVKSANSHLGFRIDNEGDFRAALARTREKIGRLAEPFDFFLDRVARPPRVEGVHGSCCIAERLIPGERQLTVEGWAMHGEIGVAGIIDSLRYPGQSSFSAYAYPSALPRSVQDRACDITRRVMQHIGYDGQAFNIELFYDDEKDDLWLLEVNTRVAGSHSQLYHYVDGASNHEMSVACALGHKPAMPYRQGDWPVAVKFYVRSFEDGFVRHVPSPERVAEIEADMPGVRVDVRVKEGERLGEIEDQDSYSYELAWVFVGADDRQQAEERFERVRKRLGMEVVAPRAAA